jgi:hypothetical protein
MAPASPLNPHFGDIMKKVNTTHLTAGLLGLLIARSALMAAQSAAPAPGFIGEQGGRGDRLAVAQSQANMRLKRVLL